MNYKLIAYAGDFVSFLIQELDKELCRINAIILYGSVSRGEADKESDVDLFIETKDPKMEDKVNRIISDFYDSAKFTSYWKLLGVQNEFKCVAGELKKWKSLERGIISAGLTLYGKYKGEFKTGSYFLFKVAVKMKRSESVKLWRKLYGYQQKVGKKIYRSKGLIEEFGGRKIARGIFLIPLEHSQEMVSYLKEKRIGHEVMEFLTDAQV